MSDLFTAPTERPIETLPDALEALIRMFPKHAGEITAWTASYARVLGSLTGDSLRQAFHVAIDNWQRSSPPKPSDFRAFAPTAAKVYDPAGDAQRRMLQVSRAAHVEKAALIDRTLMAYTETIAAHAREIANLPSVHVGSIVVTPADCLRTATVLHVRKKAWPLACETARGGTPYAHVEIEPSDWQSIREHAETMCLHSGGNASRALQSRPDPRAEARREEMKRRAEEWHGDHVDGGEPITSEERQAALEHS